METYEMRFIKFITLFILLTTSLSAVSIGVLKYRGGDWYSCIPSVKNFISNINKRFNNYKLRLAQQHYSPTDRNFFQNSIYVLNGHGKIFFNDEEIKMLRIFLKNGGFIFANDDYGMDISFRKFLKRLYPKKKLTILSHSHQIYSGYFKLPNGLPKIHKHKGGASIGYGLFVNGRMVIFYSYNTDIIDGWDKVNVHKNTAGKREAAFRMGFNILHYAMTR